MDKDRLRELLRGWKNPDAGGPETLSTAEQAARLSGRAQKAKLPDGSNVEVRVDGYGRGTRPVKTRRT